MFHDAGRRPVSKTVSARFDSLVVRHTALYIRWENSEYDGGSQVRVLPVHTNCGDVHKHQVIGIYAVKLPSEYGVAVCGHRNQFGVNAQALRLNAVDA